MESVGSGWKTPHSGSQSLVLKNWMGAGDGVEQKSDVTAMTTYDLSFYSLWDGGYDGSMAAQVRWIDAGGSQIGSNMFAWTKGAADAWTLTAVQVTSIVNTARAEINLDNSGGTSGALYIDDVAFDAAAVPEPATAGLVSLVGLALLALRRKQS